MIKLETIEAGAIPPNYAKVIDVGPEGETSGIEIMPIWSACAVLGLDDPSILGNGRLIIVNHPHGATIITFSDKGAASETIGID